jgi:Transposase IS116/IS110/IS902 family
MEFADGFNIALVVRRGFGLREYGPSAALKGVGPVLAGVFVAEIGDVSRFSQPAKLCSWAGLTPRQRVRHDGPPGSDHDGGLRAGALGGGRGDLPLPRRGRDWAASPAVAERRGATSAASPTPASS